ncbi:MAG: TFIIB-type zinc ribbon-containing protein [Candidatus Moraniibacteriota bacterium]
MKCPICEIDLMMTDRQGVEIDYCSKCRGVWLDRGELDKIIEKSSSIQAPVQREYSAKQANDDRFHEDDYHNYRKNEKHYSDNEYSYKKKHKKEGFLGDLFDF